MKIAVVGNGKLSKKYGDDIDKCNLIIRFNQAKTKGYEDYVGANTDLLSIVSETSLSYEYAANRLDRDVIKNVNYILINGNKRNVPYENIIAGIKGEPFSVIFKYLDYSYFDNLCNSLLDDYKPGKNPSTGLNTIAYLIATNNELDGGNNEYFIYGFDGFESGSYFNDNKRNNKEFHPVDVEMVVLKKLSELENISVFT